MKTASSVVLALCATFALFSVVCAKAVAEAEAKPEAEAGILGLNDANDYRFAGNGLTANALVNPYTDLRPRFNVFRGGVGAARHVVPFDSALALRGLTPIYNPSEFTGYGGYGTATSLAAQAKLRGISAARAALINQAIANQYYDNLLRSW